jgi:hypothetical protein
MCEVFSVMFVSVSNKSYHKLIIFLSCLMAVFLLLPPSLEAGVTGSGTSGDPFVVDNWGDLDAKIRDAAVMTYIELANDIDAASSATYAGRMITIDGKGHKIKSPSAGNPNTGLRFNNPANVITLRNVTFEDLQTGGAGGASTVANYGYGGGALSVRAGSITIENCAFINNKNIATGNNGGGGAVYLQNAGVFNATNSTFFGNEAVRRGGAIRVQNAGSSGSIVNCTITGNNVTGSDPGGGFGTNTTNNVRITNSIVAGNNANTVAGDIDSGSADGGWNLIGAAPSGVYTPAEGTALVGANITSVVVNAAAGPVVNTPGATPTFALGGANATLALAKANPDIAPLADQRGVFRDLLPDIGAHENTEYTAVQVSDFTGLDTAIRAAALDSRTVIELTGDIDATTSATYPCKWIVVNGNGYAIYDDDGEANTSLRFSEGYAGPFADVTLYNLTMRGLKSGGGTPNYTFGGGAIGIMKGSLTVDKVSFVHNENHLTLTTTRQGNNAGGGAINVQQPGGLLKISNSVFHGNSVARSGGVGGGVGGAIRSGVPTTITNTVFDENTSAGMGGAIVVGNSGASLSVDAESSFTGNTAAHSGGAINILGTGMSGEGAADTFYAVPVKAEIYASFGTGGDANTDGIAGGDTDNYVLSVCYPSSFTANITGDKQSDSIGILTVNGIRQGATFFADAWRSNVNNVIGVRTHQELKDALGYVKYLADQEQWDVDATGHGNVTEGSAVAGDIVYLAQSMTSSTDPHNPSLTPTIDDITGATVYVTKDVSIFGNGYTINGQGYPVFDIDGGEGAFTANIINLNIRNGGYTRKLGGAVFVEGDGALNLNRVNFINCFAAGGGDTGISGGGGAIYLDPHGAGTPKLTAVNSTFTGNRAAKGTGGAISASNAEVTLTGCTFTGNEAAQGGAVGVKRMGSFTLGANNAFIENKAANAGGAIDIHYGISWSNGRNGVTEQPADISTTINGISTFTDNTSKWGDKISYSRYYGEGAGPDGTEPHITFGPANGASLDMSIVADLTFSDLYRTSISGSGDDPDGPDVPDVPPVVSEVEITLAPDGSVNQSVKGAAGVDITDFDRNDNASALDQLGHMGIEVSLSGGSLVFSGVATDIGNVNLAVVTADGEEDVRVEVKPLAPVVTDVIDSVPAQWTGEISEIGTTGEYSFVVRIPVALTEAEKASIAGGVSTSVSAVATNISGVTTSNFVPASGGGYVIEVHGNAYDPDAVVIDSVAYRIGINQSSQPIGVSLSSANLDRDDVPPGGGSSGGCDAGASAAALLLGAAIFTLRGLRKDN